jgi:hypothetical protein
MELLVVETQTYKSDAREEISGVIDGSCCLVVYLCYQVLILLKADFFTGFGLKAPGAALKAHCNGSGPGGHESGQRGMQFLSRFLSFTHGLR